MPAGNAARIPTWSEACEHNASKTLARLMLTSNDAGTQSRSFNLLLCCMEDNAPTGEGNYQHVTFRLFGGFGNDPWQARDPLFELQAHSSTNPVILSLPLSLPDDRRDRTSVALVP